MRAFIGPMIGSAVMDVLGAENLLLASAVIHGLQDLFCLSRILVREQVPAEEKESFVAVARSTPEIFEHDPRGE